MITHISDLYNISQKQERTIIGLMSGTSLDGLDIALCNVSGSGLDTNIKLIHFHTEPYDKGFKEKVKSIFSKKEVDLEKLCLINPWIAEQHGKMILACLKKWKVSPQDIDLIASHGQTIYHAPKSKHNYPEYGNATLQIGDGDHLAYNTGIITISDFRQKHIAAGGEGAPLAFYGDYLILSSREENRVLLNIGGIANFTFLPKSMDASQTMCADTGPGNTMMDAYVQANYPGMYYDKDAEIAKAGQINTDILCELKNHRFFKAPLPKTTGPELFNMEYLLQAIKQVEAHEVSHEDILATLCKFSADTIVESILSCPFSEQPYTIYTSGGGISNPLLMQYIQEQLPHIRILTTENIGINPEAKEAILFAILANECVAGTGVHKEVVSSFPDVSMGKISFPK